MSTRATIKLVKTPKGDWHLYTELTGDPWCVSLSFPLPALRAGSYELVLDIPAAVWASLRQEEGVREKYLSMTPEDLRKEAEAWVDQRLKRYQGASTEALRSLVAFGGCAIADIDWPRDRQIEAYIVTYTPPDKKEA